MFKKLGISKDNQFEVVSLNTDKIPAYQDEEALQKIKDISSKLL